MYVCSDSECNTMREPVCGRGGPVTAASVEGTGPGSACKPPPPPPPPAPVAPSRGCRVKVVVNDSARPYRVQRSTQPMQVC
jgi:hypothetical protein